MPSSRASRPLLTLLLLPALAVMVAACGHVSTAGPSTSATAVPPSAEPATEQTVTSLTGSASDTPTVQEAVAVLAESAEPLVVFAPAYLPEDAVLATGWWPVVEFEDPALYPEPAQPNPRVTTDGSMPQAEVVISVGEGWLDLLQNFRGDVGDTPGRPVGEVAGLPATLFEINGGTLVQWQREGLWYGVFGRGVPEEQVMRVALSMTPAGE